jgi:heterodisulfide reductase subunit A-like polyferredoxin
VFAPGCIRDDNARRRALIQRTVCSGVETVYPWRVSAEPRPESIHVETDVLIIGSGGAGMYAAIEAARAGASVFPADRSLIGRGGATVMAQVTAG